MADEKKNETVEYFRSPGILWFVAIVPSMLYLSILAYKPEIIPFESLGFIGSFSKYLYTNHKLITILT